MKTQEIQVQNKKKLNQQKFACELKHLSVYMCVCMYKKTFRLGYVNIFHMHVQRFSHHIQMTCMSCYEPLLDEYINKMHKLLRIFNK